jgi:hypothetical protein
VALTNFQPNNDGFRAIANSAAVKAALKDIAERGKSIAEGLAQDFRITGDYADSFEVRETTVQWEGEYPGPRAAAQLVNTSGHSLGVEYGYRGSAKDPGQSAHHVLGRTLDALAGDA